MFANEPALAEVGVPLSWPVPASNVAQSGLFAIVKVRVSPSASEATGVKEYVWPAIT
jgi:hypothetical protein